VTVSSFASRSSWSRKATKWLPWIAGVVFVAGGITFLIVFVGNTAEQRDIHASPGATFQDLSGVPKSVPVDPKARFVAGKFITTAVTRKDLKTAWKLSEPNSFVRPKGMTLKQYLSGNIPVQFFPAKAIDGAAFKVETSFKNELTLNVYLYAKPGSGIPSQPFFIVLRPRGEGKNRHWLVNNFVPSAGVPPVPVGEAGGVG
jgi:hypothetical protein